MLLWTAKEALEVATQSPSISAPLAQGWSRVVSIPPPPLGGASFGDGSPRDGGEPPSLGGGGARQWGGGGKTKRHQVGSWGSDDKGSADHEVKLRPQIGIGVGVGVGARLGIQAGVRVGVELELSWSQSWMCMDESLSIVPGFAPSIAWGNGPMDRRAGT